ncbi:RloA protein [Acinetobacter baumannii]|uniref:ATP-binding protein n=5 Tax=Acinetobacter calcoaceticus/baumannii complex TaxID=909768 RepID=A0A5P6FTA7_ACIBA|nr:ATP-binding protein [Acinetobacter baumannii]MBH8251015.1 ATP-binding protein [Acinetobacter baumannii]MBS5992829.1 ATP-binding protein [Acinetobacter baumannii]MCW1519490.1 ATP-binding protein [Acinetobacter baumannii]MDA4981388.1 ATP-binding protein [Acinetobacter baumannii]MDV4297468.1 ATP-binding protein [Acinetobacter baumannii]
MIIDFSIENFLSFKEQQTLSFVAEPPYDIHPEHLLDTPEKDLKLLKTIVIYGANASGKSNFLSAIHFLKQLILKSAENKPDEKFDLIPFLLDKELKNSATSFDINFFCNEIRYNYSLVLDKSQVFHEHLNYYPKKYKKNIFSRDLNNLGEYEYSIGTDLKPKRIYEDTALKTLPNVLFLSKMVQENSQFLKPIYDWFSNTLSEQFSLEDTAKSIHSDENFKKRFLKFLENQDIDIVDINVDKGSLAEQIIKNNNFTPEVQEKILEDLKNRYYYDIKTYHRNSDNELEPFDLELESQGTRKLFALSSLLLNNYKKFEKTFYVDELSSALHPLLVKNFLKEFNHTTFNQLICVTHDTHLINQECLRKDQIYFVEKDKSQVSSLYSLLEFNPRNDRENWELRYLSGRYGATPFFG